MNLNDGKLFRQQNYIDGAWCDADGSGVIEVDNPATGAIIGTVPRMAEEGTRQAIAAADNALPAWRDCFFLEL